jgi:hypothetical protein
VKVTIALHLCSARSDNLKKSTQTPVNLEPRILLTTLIVLLKEVADQCMNRRNPYRIDCLLWVLWEERVRKEHKNSE